MSTKTKSRNVTERTSRNVGPEWRARVTGRVLNRVLDSWDTHGGACRPTDHPDTRDQRDCARGEHS